MGGLLKNYANFNSIAILQVWDNPFKVCALNIARLGLNDGAKLWISFKLFPKQTFFIMHIRDLHIKGFVCFEKSLKEIHSFALSFNPRRATFNALT